jgi:hypothetical protein
VYTGKIHTHEREQKENWDPQRAEKTLMMMTASGKKNDEPLFTSKLNGQKIRARHTKNKMKNPLRPRSGKRLNYYSLSQAAPLL